MVPLRLLASALASWIVVVASAGALNAQSAGCALEQIGGTDRHRLDCTGGITIVVEAGADYSLIHNDADNELDGVKLDDKALLLEAPPAAVADGFEVIAPQAIAAVRGTKWAVDAQAGKTSVFVVEGSVAVRPTSGATAVNLGPGEGVDVGTSAEPLSVRRWPAARVSALMARFGL